MPQIDAIHHLAVKAADVERLASFYRDLLGLKEIARHPDASGLRSIWLEIGGSILMIERADPPQERTTAPPFADAQPGFHLLAFTIAPTEREAWKKNLEAQGHPIVHETGYTIYLLDPEGNRLGLSSYPDRSHPDGGLSPGDG